MYLYIVKLIDAHLQKKAHRRGEAVRRKERVLSMHSR